MSRRSPEQQRRDPEVAVDVLLQALPYIEQFRGRVVVVKFGGNAMSSPELFADFAKDVVMMHRVGMRPVVVHGGGPQIAEWLRRLGKESEFVDGRRVTDAETLEVAQMVLIGKVNSDIVTALNTFGPLALGLSGTDAMLLEAEVHDPDLGFVGSVTKVNPELITRTLSMDLIPVIATIGVDESGQTYNINADDAATEVAQTLRAEKLIFLTDVPGLLADVGDPDSLITEVDTDEVRDFISRGVISGGMIPKMAGCVRAIENGVGQVHLIDGRLPHVLLLELLTHAGVGTMVTASAVTTEDPDMTDPLMSTYPEPPVTFVRGEGSWLYDDQDRRYLDLLCGLAVTSLGHCHPAVADALATQSRRLLHVSNLYGNEHNRPLATTLDRLLGGGGQVFFSNSGAEANECAIKLARKFGGRGRHVVVSAYGSFHGRTLATLHATGQPAKHEAFQPLPEGFRHVTWADLDELERSLDDTVAAVLLEPVQGEGGVNPATSEYFRGVRRLCDERGILFMVDEVQTGLGRCGAWFAHQRLGVVPDVVTVAKALGNGVPIGACWARAEVASVFVPGDHATTFGGQPLAAAAARAVLAVMEDVDAPLLAERIGERFRQLLDGSTGVASVRGLGALLAIELDTTRLGAATAGTIAAELLDRGVVVNAVTPTALRLAPSLLMTDDEIRHGATAIAAAVAAALAAAEREET